MSFYSCTTAIAADQSYFMRECVTPDMVAKRVEIFSDGDYFCSRTLSTTDAVMRIACESFGQLLAQVCPAKVDVDVRLVPDSPEAFDDSLEVYATVLTGMAVVMITVLGGAYLIYRCLPEGS